MYFLKKLSVAYRKAKLDSRITDLVVSGENKKAYDALKYVEWLDDPEDILLLTFVSFELQKYREAVDYSTRAKNRIVADTGYNADEKKYLCFYAEMIALHALKGLPVSGRPEKYSLSDETWQWEASNVRKALQRKFPVET